MRKLKFTSLFCAALLLSHNAICWGGKGHDIIAEIATNHLTPKAKAAVTKSLDGRSLVYYSTWLDNVRSDSRFDSTSTWHYANVDEGYTYQTMPKNPNGDVYTATVDIVKELKNKDLNDSLRTLYTKYLVHLVGDLHCPMHTGHLSDLGGNKWDVKWFNSKTNLHSIWDSKLIESTHPWSYTEWAQNIDVLTPAQVKKVVRGDILDWFNETVAASNYLYKVTPRDSTQSYKYIYDNSQMLEEHLVKAGHRLAAILNEIYR